MPKLVTVDFETYYAADYSLSKMPTEEYIRDDRFEVIGCAIGLGPNNVRWYPQPEVEAALRAIDWSDAMLVCQNTAFDGAILAWKYGIVPMAYADTLGMSRALYPHEMKHGLAAQAERAGLGVKGDTVHRVVGMRYADFTSYELREYGEYCVNDVVLTRDLFGHYLGLGFPTKEMKLIDLTLRMYIEPVLQLDAALLHAHRNDVLATKEQLLTDLKQAFIESADPDALMAIFAPENGGIKKLLMSNEKFATLLRSFGVEPPTKISKTTGKVAYAFAKTDQEFLELREHPDLKVAALVDARLGNKSTIEESRTERFIAMASRGNFPVPLRYYGAHSGRWSGCLVADTEVMVYDPVNGVRVKRIVDVLADDFVWDGIDFVPHEGVVFSGYREVVTWDGVTGTEDHVVFTDAGEISLRNAMQGAHRITPARSPEQDAVDRARRLASTYKG